MEAVNEANKWNSRGHSALLTRSLLRMRNGASEQAQADFDAVLALKPQLKKRIEKLVDAIKTKTVAEALYPVEAPSEDKSKTSSNSSIPSIPKGLPESAIKSYDAGVELHKQAKFKEAEAEFRRAITLAPRFAIAHLYRGACFSQLGRDQEAERAFAESTRIDPSLKPLVPSYRVKEKP